ncbi:nuclease-related domain-containing protein [Arsukibacterium sp.]|uniref:nuclease-related domain-containing protein n=1 Tax=Arsukibacterium sp. TaxID=1977258 RepID=UPI00299DF2CC|nr:nuclease-related domain-containing protein [Arsukibacterium sp.]MDX1536237.1 nuclease-related domain-containing protein [Arsukibacterium sp.]
MILKEKIQTNSSSVKLAAGINQEQDVAFYLRRAYRNSNRVMVLNDLRIEHDGETAQIDHLIVHSFGFTVVESKSIRGEVRVNEHGEWSRSYKGQWSGMPSPIKQAELQLKLLKEYLCDNTLQIIGKFLGVQQGLGARTYDVFCAISSDAIIDRSAAPAALAHKLVKSEFIADALDKQMNFKKFYQLVAKVADTRPTFNEQELMRICWFLLGETNQAVTEFTAIEPQPVSSQIPQPAATEYPIWQGSVANEVNEPPAAVTRSPIISVNNDVKNTPLIVQCKHCGECSGLSPQSGRFGYYVQCSSCGGNTPLKRPCVSCSSQNTRVSKAKALYRLVCGDCQSVSEFR